MESLPGSWEKSKLGDICSKPQYGWTSKASKNGKIIYLRTTDISNGRIFWDNVPFCLKEPVSVDKYKIEENDILVSRAGSVGISYRITEVPKLTVFASYLIRFKPIIIKSKFVEYFLKTDTYWKSISDYTAGIAIPNVNATKLSSLDIPIPPLEEQRRIVEKLDKLLTKVESAKARLEKIPLLLKQFRQSVLSAAVSGELTKDWREENPSIRQNKKLGSTDINIQIGPFGSLLHKSDYIINGIPVINPMHIVNGKIQPTSAMTISKEKISSLKRYTLKKDDVIIGRRGEMGKCAVVDESFSGCLCGTGSLFIRPNNEFNSYYLQLLFSSPVTISYLEGDSVGTTMSNLNQRIISNYEIEIPSLDEQTEIVKRVEALFQTADQVEARYQKAKAYVDKLQQSILAKAFRGELVPQDPNDEPASVLLERIRAEKEKLESRKKKGKKAK